MKKHLSIVLFTAVIVACTQSKQTDEVKPVDGKMSTTVEAGLFQSESKQGKILLLADKFSLYDKSGKIMGDAGGLYGLTFSLDSISDKRIDIAKTGDNCNEFNFVKVNSPKVGGWLYSANVFSYGTDKRDTVFSAGNINFKLYRAQNFGVGVSDDDGLTGCTAINPVVLHNSKFDVEAFVPLKDNTGKYPGNFLVLDEHDGWYDSIKETAFEDGKLRLVIYREYQEGSAYFTILISLSDKGYFAIVTDVK